MDIVTILSRAYEAGIEFYLEEESLRYRAPQGAFTPELKEIVKKNRQEIIEFLQRQQKRREVLMNKIPVVSRQERMPISYGQKWLWLSYELNRESTAYYIPAAFKIKGTLNPVVLEKSLNQIVMRHEILRTIYEKDGDEVYQRILPNVNLSIMYKELQSDLMEVEEDAVLAEINQLMRQPFVLDKGPLIRVELLHIKEDEYVFILIFHHIICDNQSMAIFFKELIQVYSDMLAGKEENFLEELPIQYADYAVWQQNMLNSAVKQEHINYFDDLLQGMLDAPEIGGDYNRPDVLTVNSIREHYMMEKETCRRLKEFSQKTGCSMYVTLLSILKILLYQYTGRRDIVVGSPVAGRNREELQGLIGLFFNTIVIRHPIDVHQTFKEYCQSVGETVASSISHQEMPFELLTDELHVAKKPNRTPIFQVLFNMYQTSYKGKLPGAEMEVYNEEMIGGQNVNSKFDITLLAIEHEDGIQIDFSFKADLYCEKTVHWLVEQFKKLTNVIAQQPSLSLAEMPNLKPIAHAEVVVTHPYKKVYVEDVNQSIIQRFDQMAEQDATHIAVQSKERTITYQELKQRSEIIGSLIYDKVTRIPRLSKKERDRYARQLILDGWGLENQEKLKGLTVFAAGAGGSGSPVIMQLALLGVGTIILCDFDVVELSNLNRQALHDESRIGMNKAESAALSVKRMNPNVHTIVRTEKITRENIDELVGDATIIFDNVDNLDAKFAISECAVRKKIPHVISSMIERSSYAAIFHTPYTPCFHCCYDVEKLQTVQDFRREDSSFEKLSNSVASPSLFLSAGFAVNEAIKIALGLPNPAYNKYFFFNNQASTALPKTRGYQIVTYPFSQFFMDTCKKNGFDWEDGFTGKFVEEVEIEKNPVCPLCTEVLVDDEVHMEQKSEKENAIVRYDCEESDIVGLLIGHNAFMVEGIMGVLRCGFAYVPLDAEYPMERLCAIMEDTNAHCILCDDQQEELAYKIRECVNKNIVVINIQQLDKMPREVVSELHSIECKRPQPEDVAYVLYTSGSMGKPKGVMQTNRNILHYIMNYTNGLHIGRDDRVSLIPSFIFSAAMMDVFAALTNGASLYLYDFKKEGPKKLGDWINDNQISVYHSVPTVFRHFTRELEEGERFDSLRVIDFGGEPVMKTDLDEYKKWFGQDCILVNGLGATELNVIRQNILNHDSTLVGSSVPVGYPVEDTDIYIVDDDGNQLGYNQIGEIVIASDYLSIGYLGLEEETKKFFGQELGQKRTYHTGDLGVIRPDTCMEHLGRKDLQIKIRGIRVEPAEIETKMLDMDEVKEAVVISQEDEHGSKHLVAYITCHEQVDGESVKERLKEILPSYMVPTYIICLEEMPLTVTGKINRKMLPSMECGKQARRELAQPENEMQQLLVDIWKSVLHMEQIGIHDQFTDLGGDSIQAIRVNSELIQRGYQVKVQDIIEAGTIRELSLRIKVHENAATIVDATEDIYVPMTPTQIDYFEFYQHKDRAYWNMATILYNKNRFNAELLRQSIMEILCYHEELRVTFPVIKGERVQLCRSKDRENLYGFYELDVSAEEDEHSKIAKSAEDIQQRNNLEDGPLLQFGLFRGKSEDYLLVSISHLLCDYMSVNILLQDFLQVYSQLEQGIPVALPAKTSSFLAWSKSMNDVAFSVQLKNVLPYWMAIHDAEIELLPTDYKCDSRIEQYSKTITRQLPAKETELILCELTQKYHVSMETIVLQTLGRAIRAWCDIDKIRVDFAIHGRSADYDGLDVSRTVGWFATAVPILINSESRIISEQLNRLQETIESVPGNLTDYYILRNITLKNNEDGLSLHQPKEIFVNYFGERSTTEMEQQVNQSMGISNISTGACVSKDADAGHKLTSVIACVDGALTITLGYNSKEYMDSTIELLAQLYMEEFRNLIK